MVYDVNAIDIIGERNDGGIDLFIISSGKFEDSVEQQTLLLDKIENYLVYLNSIDFTKDFPNVSSDNKYIKLKVCERPSDMTMKWLSEIATWIQSNGAKFSIVYSS